MEDIVLQTSIKNLHLAPSNIGLVGIEKEFYDKKNRKKELILKEKLDKISKNMIL